jgi:drug/metabolite transporter (DMT)-like permease
VSGGKFLLQETHADTIRWMTHGSWSLLWPFCLLVLRIQKRDMPWRTFWRRHKQILRTTAQMVRAQDLHLLAKDAHESPIPYMLRTTVIVTTALTVAGGSWYVAVLMTTPSDLTAIYNCSAFFAYAFSIPLLGDKLRFDKIFSVAVAIAGVLVVAYGDSGAKSGETGPDAPGQDRAWGNIIIGIGSVLYGLYEVLYKRMACPPEGCSPGRGMIFAMTVGSLIGSFTLFVLWIPLPILHFTGLETFEFPTGEKGWIMLISVIANASMAAYARFTKTRVLMKHSIFWFISCFDILNFTCSFFCCCIVCMLLFQRYIAKDLRLTIFIVAIVDTLKPDGEPLSTAAIIGGILIIGAFLLLSWSTYREMEEERRKK